MQFALTILGVNGATPAHGRFPTSQYLQVNNDHFLIDCGEGAQMRMSKFGVPRQKINHIFISHLHGDHIFGLPGLLFSLALNDRKKPLHIYSPLGLEKMISVLLPEEGGLPFPIHFHVLNTEHNELIFENKNLTVHSFPLKHRVPTCGFRFEEKVSEKNIIKEKIAELDLSIDQIIAVKNGEDLNTEDGKVIPNESLTHAPWQPRSYAFVSDSVFCPAVIPHIKGVSLLYHESTFCEAFLENAERTMHSTASQAAEIAHRAKAGRLILGHYSSRYQELDQFLDESRPIFEQTFLGEEGKVYTVERVRQIKNPA